jgi:MvdD family ATP-grasp ribosomal peptide maturase
MKIMVITYSDDNECIEMVSREVESRGGQMFRFDTDLYPTEVLLSVQSTRQGDRTIMTTAAGEACLEDLTGVWYRRQRIAEDLPEDMESQLRRASVRESRFSMYGMLANLSVFCMDPLPRIRYAENKTLQLRIAREVGLDIPRTLTSNDPREVRRFAADCTGGMVTKMLSPFAIYDDAGHENVVFTTEVGAHELEDLDGLRLCPMTFQEMVAKDIELRVTVVGNQIFTAAIDSQQADASRVDWRRNGIGLIDAWQHHQLPSTVNDSLLAFMDHFGLNYGAIDLILTPDGRYVFLEVNPVGEFFWLERVPGLPISAAIADVLLDQVPRR